MAVKKSLFNKPAWAAKASNHVQDNRPIFEQNIYEDILEVNRKREEKRLVRQREREEQRRKSASRDTQIDEDTQPTKKQRVSTELAELNSDEYESDLHNPESESDAHSSESRTSQRELQRKKSPVQDSHRSTLPKSPQTKRSSRRGQNRKNGGEIDAVTTVSEQEDDEVVVTNVVSKPRSSPQKLRSKLNPQPPPPDSDSDPEDDEYVKDLKRVARAEARTNPLHTSKHRLAPRIDDQPPATIPSNLPDTKDKISRSDVLTPSTADTDTSDLEISIMIRTIIPNCADIFVKRRASQPLDMVLDWFIKHHQLNSFLADKVFFTWNGTRLYKSTTMRSILATIKKKHGTKVDGSDLAEGKIEIEAVTEEIYQHRLKQKERQKKVAESGGEWQPDDEISTVKDSHFQRDAGSTEQYEQHQQKRAGGTVLHLTSDGDESLPEMHLRVHSNTTIERIVNGYKKKMRVDATRQIYLVFDGERLDLEQTVADVGFEEGDRIDIRSK